MASRDAKIAAFDGVVEEAIDAVAVVLIILRGVDAALRGDGVGAARRILEAETLDVVAELGQRGGGGSAGQSGADHDDFVLALVGGIDQLHFEASFVPGSFDGAAGDAWGRVALENQGNDVKHDCDGNRDESEKDEQ